MDLMVVGLVFVAAAFLAFALLNLWFSEERRVAKALRTVSAWESQQAAAAEPLLLPFAQRVLGPVVGKFLSAISSLTPAASREIVRHKLDLAGSPSQLSPDGVFGLRIACSIGAAVVMAVVLIITRTAPVSFTAWVVLAFSVGFFAPGAWLDSRRRRRQDEIRRALPDMLDMLTISVQAGMGFDMALTKLVRSTTGPLSEEFAHMLNEVQAGVTRRDALRHMGDRTEVAELDNFIVSMVQADVFGVSISGILRTQAAELRKRRRLYAEERAQKVPVQMVFPIILCILPATMLVILGPAVIAIGKAFGMIQ
jgi:tight adherence protein C